MHDSEPLNTTSLSEAEFYQRFPLRLILGFALVPFGCIVYALAAASDAAFPRLMLVVQIAGLFSLLFILFGVANTFAILFRPALQLTQTGLSYRGFYVPWNEVRDIVRFKTKDGSGLGVVVSSGFAEAPADGFRSKAMHSIIRRRGLLPIPPMKGVETNDLLGHLLKKVVRL